MYTRAMKKLFIALLFVSIFPLSASANDTTGYVLPTGGVVFKKQNGIKMQVEALRIRPKQIEVNYLFENTTDKDITTQVFFPLPPISAVLDYYRDYSDATHQFNFKLWINGKETDYQTHFSLKQGEKNVPDIALQLWQTPEEAMDENVFHERVSKMSEQDRQLLVDGKYLKWDWLFKKNPKTKEWEESEGWTITSSKELLWKKQISYSWEQTFPAHKTVTIRHTYFPSFKTTNTGRPFSQCINYESQEYQNFIFVPENERDDPWDDRLAARDYLEYIITTANNWQGPIENFNLLVESPFKSVGCFDGQPFYGERYYAINRSNYTPQGDLSVDFLGQYFTRAQALKTVPTLFRLDGPANLRDKPNGKIIGQLADKTYVWAWPEEKNGKWYPVRQNDLSGYTHKQNLIKVF